MSCQRYVLLPGNVYSKDGDCHYISFRMLAELYDVDLSQCVDGRAIGFKQRPNDIALYPRQDGDYKLPKNAQIERITLINVDSIKVEIRFDWDNDRHQVVELFGNDFYSVKDALLRAVHFLQEEKLTGKI